jgi:hypothetical protein
MKDSLRVGSIIPTVWCLDHENEWASPRSPPAATWVWSVASDLDISAMGKQPFSKQDLKKKNC